jgi:hypothetical protein
VPRGSLRWFAHYHLLLPMEESRVKCIFYHSSKVRLSHFCWFDLRPLLSLRVLVRCRSCRDRDYAKLSSAWRLIFRGKAPRPRRNGERTGVESA